MKDEEQYGLAADRDQLNSTSVEILLTDSRLALTFISVAETTTIQETVERNIHNARKAYDSIQNLRTQYVFTDSQTDTLDSNLAQIKSRLQVLGETF